MKAIILAGGKGRRLRPFTTTIPKPLFPVGEKPILQIIVEQLKAADITEITIAIGYLGELIEAYFRDGSRFGVSIAYSREYTPLGTAGPISLVGGLHEDFLVMNGDVLTTLNLRDLTEYHREHGKMATICCYEKEVQSSLGIIRVDSKGAVSDYIEKPVTKYLVSTGIYCFRPAVTELMERGEKLDLPDLVMRLKVSGSDVMAYKLKGMWFDIGTREDLELATEYWASEWQDTVHS